MPNQEIIETEAKPVPLKHIYTTSHCPGILQALQYKLAGLNSLNGRKSHLTYDAIIPFFPAGKLTILSWRAALNIES